MQGRRAFLRKAVATAGITGSVISSAEPVAAGAQTLSIESRSGTSNYDIDVNDPNGSAKGELDSEDSVKNGSSKTKFEGTVEEDDVDEYTFDGQLTGMLLNGDIRLTVDNPNGINREGELTIKGGGDSEYWVKVTDRFVESRSSELESGDGVTYYEDEAEGTLGFSDTDTYYGDGAIEAVSVVAPASNSTVITHDI